MKTRFPTRESINVGMQLELLNKWLYNILAEYIYLHCIDVHKILLEEIN